MPFFVRASDMEAKTTASMFARHQVECGERYQETTRSLEKIESLIATNQKENVASLEEVRKESERWRNGLNNRIMVIGSSIICALIYVIYNILKTKGIF